jgi:hypothetical protein
MLESQQRARRTPRRAHTAAWRAQSRDKEAERARIGVWRRQKISCLHAIAPHGLQPVELRICYRRHRAYAVLRRERRAMR